MYDMPKVIKKKIKFTCVKDIREVLEIALEEKILPVKGKSEKKPAVKAKTTKRKTKQKKA